MGVLLGVPAVVAEKYTHTPRTIAVVPMCALLGPVTAANKAIQTK